MYSINRMYVQLKHWQILFIQVRDITEILAVLFKYVESNVYRHTFGY